MKNRKKEESASALVERIRRDWGRGRAYTKAISARLNRREGKKKRQRKEGRPGLSSSSSQQWRSFRRRPPATSRRFQSFFSSSLASSKRSRRASNGGEEEENEHTEDGEGHTFAFLQVFFQLPFCFAMAAPTSASPPAAITRPCSCSCTWTRDCWQKMTRKNCCCCCCYCCC